MRPASRAIALAAAMGMLAAPAGAVVDDMRARILRHLQLRPGMAVAEIGAGPGWFVVNIAESIGPEGIVYATDIDPAALDNLRTRVVPNLESGSARVELRHCRGERDTGLDDLPDERLDLINVVDSVCFETKQPKQENVAYLRRLRRILRPGGRLTLHMDCHCEISREDLVALFTDAGFTLAATEDVGPDPATVPPDWPCRTAAERARHALLAIFQKPASSAQ